MGLSPSEWEDLTPGQFSAYAAGFLEQQELEQQVMNANIYNLSGLIRSAVWSKHMPKYGSVFPEKKKEKKKMTDEEMYRSVLALNALFGGNQKEKEVGHGCS